MHAIVYTGFMQKKLVVIGIVLVVLAFGAGYLLNQSDESSNNTPSTGQPVPQDSANRQQAATGAVSSLATYTVPDGWDEANCEDSEAVYIVRSGSSVNCNENPAAPFKLSVDSGDTKDCNELQNVSEVKKHTCISLFINNMRSLKAETEYLASSQYGKDVSFITYYIDTGEGVVKAEYAYQGNTQYQADFEQLVNSVNAR